MYSNRLITACLLIAAFTPPISQAQPTPPAPFQQLLGTWKWHAGTDTFRLVLQREPTYKMPDGTVFSVILGRHSYAQNGVVVEQSLDIAGQNGNPGFTLFGIPRDYHSFYMSFHDLTKNKQGRVTLKLVPGNSNALHWHLTVPTETVGINSVIPEGFSVPTDLVLTRVGH